MLFTLATMSMEVENGPWEKETASSKEPWQGICSFPGGCTCSSTTPSPPKKSVGGLFLPQSLDGICLILLEGIYKYIFIYTCVYILMLKTKSFFEKKKSDTHSHHLTLSELWKNLVLRLKSFTRCTSRVVDFFPGQGGKMLLELQDGNKKNKISTKRGRKWHLLPSLDKPVVIEVTWKFWKEQSM